MEVIKMSVPPSYPTKSPLSTLSHPHAYTEHYLSQLPRYKTDVAMGLNKQPLVMPPQSTCMPETLPLRLPDSGAHLRCVRKSFKKLFILEFYDCHVELKRGREHQGSEWLIPQRGKRQWVTDSTWTSSVRRRAGEVFKGRWSSEREQIATLSAHSTTRQIGSIWISIIKHPDPKSPLSSQSYNIHAFQRLPRDTSNLTLHGGRGRNPHRSNSAALILKWYCRHGNRYFQLHMWLNK